MKKVSAAVIFKVCDDGMERVFAAKKANGFWEFPGGKKEPNETSTDTVIREIKEELDADIKIDSYITTVQTDDGDVSIDAFVCHIPDNKIMLKEHISGKWLTKDELKHTRLKWYDLDKKIIQFILDNNVTLESAQTETDIDNVQKKIILEKVAYEENLGHSTLNDSDIMDIIESCDRAGHPLSYKAIDTIFAEDIETPLISEVNPKQMDKLLKEKKPHFITKNDITDVPLWIYKYNMNDNSVVKTKVFGTKHPDSYKLTIKDGSGDIINIESWNNGWHANARDINKEYMQLCRVLILSNDDDVFAYKHFGNILAKELVKARKKENEILERIESFCQNTPNSSN